MSKSEKEIESKLSFQETETKLTGNNSISISDFFVSFSTPVFVTLQIESIVPIVLIEFKTFHSLPLSNLERCSSRTQFPEECSFQN